MASHNLRELLKVDASADELASALATVESCDVTLGILRGEPQAVGTRAKVIAGLWASKTNRSLLEQLMTKAPDYACAATLKHALQLLDVPRKIRQLERKLSQRCKRQRQRSLHEELSTLKSQKVPSNFSASRSFCNAVKKSLAATTADRLEFDLLFYEESPTWPVLCDLTHSKPTNWSLPFFQRVVFGASPPEGSMLADARGLNAANIVELVERHPKLAQEALSFIRKKVDMRALKPTAKAALARACPLGDVIWHYEEMRSSLTDSIVDERLAQMEEGQPLEGHFTSKLSFAPIAERLL